MVPFVYAGILLVFFLLGLAAPEPGLWAGFLALAVGGPYVGMILFSGYLEKHRVCEHALVLGLTPWPRSRPFVIPWSTIAPESLVLHDPSLKLGVDTTTVLHPRAARLATYSRRSVSLVGLHPDLAHPRRRRWSPIAERFRAAPDGALPPEFLVRWAMAVRDPEPLLRAIEAAMVASGADARGIAQHALDHPVHGPRAPEAQGPRSSGRA
jgi:hypothetical protein